MDQQQADGLATTLAAEFGPSLAPDLADMDQHNDEIRAQGWYPSAPRSSDPSNMFVLGGVRAIDLVLVIVFRWRDDPVQKYMLTWDLAKMVYVHRVTEGWIWEQIDLRLSPSDWQSSRTTQISELLYLVR